MSKLVIKKSREFSALTLFIVSVLLACFAFVDRSRSASPVAGSITPAGPTQNWVGTAAGGASLDESTCTPATCDAYTLTLTGTPANWVGKKAHIKISWPNATDDFDVFVHKGTITGPVVASSATGGGGPEEVDLDPSIASIGTGPFVVNVVYFLVIPTDQYAGQATVVNGIAPTPTPSPGATPTPTPVPPGTPRYQTFAAPPGIGEDSGEPSIGINWNSENVVRPGSGHTFTNSNGVILNGGTALYYGGLSTTALRVTFDDCSSPANAFWEVKPLQLAGTPRALGDPILFTNNVTGRTFVSQEESAAGSTTDVSDDDLDTLLPSMGAGAFSGFDHQTVASGPYAGPTPPSATYPATGAKQAVYYAAQNVADARTSRSDDGGITFLPSIPMYTTAQCGGLHGHLKVTPDTPATRANGHIGTVYVPNNACGGTDPIGHVDGQQAAIVSEDNGLTWNVRPIPNSDTKSDRDPSIGIANDGTVYMGMQAADGHARISVTHDKGLTWTAPLDVGVNSANVTGAPNGGINNIVFPAVVAGGANRSAFAYYGT
ncbi:MAG: sialidase family protein, partial [Chthoniobacterales bacterium]